MTWDLPIEITVDGETYHISNKCDYRVVLDVIDTLNDVDYSEKERIIVALMQFYEELNRSNIAKCPHLELLVANMMDIINLEQTDDNTARERPALMDWQHDLPILAPPISRVLGYSVRNREHYTHWYDFVGAYMEIGGDCVFANVVSIRNKRAKGKKLDQGELEFFREYQKQIVLPVKLTKEEQELLNSPW